MRCEHNPPPCFWFWWWQTSGGTQKSTKKESKNNCKKRDGRQVAERKKQPKTIQKPEKIIKNRVWDHPGGSRGRLGDQFGPRAAQGSKRTPSRREKTVKKGTKMETRSNFPWAFFWCFLRCSRFRFFMILGARGLHFCFHFCSTLRALGLWENNWKCCKGCQFQRFGPCQTESFYRSWLWVCFGDFFCSFLWFLAVWELPFWELWA